MKKILIYIMRQYQRYLSPDHSLWARALDRTPHCRYTPSCSDYMIEALEKKGAIIGFGKGMGRVMRCHPWARGGYDPVEKVREKSN